MQDLVISYIGFTKSVLTWFHAAHHVTKGTGFAGDHVSLYGEIYQEIIDLFDELVEKSIVLCDSEEVACPIILSHLAAQILSSFESPSNKFDDQIAALALDVIKKQISMTEDIYHKLGSNKTLGMDDYLSSSAGKYEKFEYLLGQRIKTGRV
jgi:hypothetical protein